MEKMSPGCGMTGPELTGEQRRLAALRARLPEGRAGLLRWPEESDSTNLRLKAWAGEGAPEGSVFLAERQLAGRGRLGRSFASPPGGLYLSYLLRPDRAPEDLGELTAWAAVAVRRAIGRCCGVFPEIKWVNDLMWEGRKLCGILCETALRRSRAESLVIGVGINVASSAEDFPPELREKAASLAMTGCPLPERSALAAAVILALDGLAAEFPAAGEAYWREYREHCVTLGKEVELSDGAVAFAEELEEDFSLRLRFPDGSRSLLRSGEATLHRE